MEIGRHGQDMGGFGTDGTEWSGRVQTTLPPCKRPRQRVRIGRVGHKPVWYRRVELLDFYSEMGFCEGSPSLNTTAVSGDEGDDGVRLWSVGAGELGVGEEGNWRDVDVSVGAGVLEVVDSRSVGVDVDDGKGGGVESLVLLVAYGLGSWIRVAGRGCIDLWGGGGHLGFWFRDGLGEC
ncbi:hypothetical protein DFJ58DRAFT_839570 [Suillus subalutaceus]|uniref:uncharacterized protein n=1 Tax=Suillus subalutaceus TaxID=48586 RepID=UPI001B86827A|nr:uncharacterized protein DFJ58DRAFT_839570 [Suillus subalutaceus]KAG1861732.1 hypothetical protein DFJ58DRAFT_839570 [Suillus subalutaceus]